MENFCRAKNQRILPLEINENKPLHNNAIYEMVYTLPTLTISTVANTEPSREEYKGFNWVEAFNFPHQTNCPTPLKIATAKKIQICILLECST